MSLSISHLEPINGIPVFHAVGVGLEIDNLTPVAHSRHMLFVHQYDEENDTEIDWQGMMFYDPAMAHHEYSMLYAEDNYVKDIIDSPLANVLCCQTFFDHLVVRDQKILEIISIKSSDKEDLCVVNVDTSEVLFKPGELDVRLEIGNILVAIDFFVQDILLTHLKEVVGQNYRNDYSRFAAVSEYIDQIRSRSLRFVKSVHKESYV